MSWHSWVIDVLAVLSYLLIILILTSPTMLDATQQKVKQPTKLKPATPAQIRDMSRDVRKIKNTTIALRKTIDQLNKANANNYVRLVDEAHKTVTRLRDQIKNSQNGINRIGALPRDEGNEIVKEIEKASSNLEYSIPLFRRLDQRPWIDLILLPPEQAKQARIRIKGCLRSGMDGIKSCQFCCTRNFPSDSEDDQMKRAICIGQCKLKETYQGLSQLPGELDDQRTSAIQKML